MIIDILLKFFYRNEYDRDCCKKDCECAEASSQDTATHDVLVKLFKPQGESVESGSFEMDGKKITKEKKEKLSKVFKSAIEDLEEVLNS